MSAFLRCCYFTFAPGFPLSILSQFLSRVIGLQRVSLKYRYSYTDLRLIIGHLDKDRSARSIFSGLP